MCHQCLVHGDLKHMPPMPLHTMTSPWPFSTWEIDIIRKIHPTSSNGHEFILVAIDYFTKWVEKLPHIRFWIQRKLLNSFRPISFADMGYHMNLSLTMDYISREKQRSCYDSSTFSTTNPHLTILRLMEQLRLQTQRTTSIGTCNYPMHSGGIGHQFDLS